MPCVSTAVQQTAILSSQSCLVRPSTYLFAVAVRNGGRRLGCRRGPAPGRGASPLAMRLRSLSQTLCCRIDRGSCHGLRLGRGPAAPQRLRATARWGLLPHTTMGAGIVQLCFGRGWFFLLRQFAGCQCTSCGRRRPRHRSTDRRLREPEAGCRPCRAARRRGVGRQRRRCPGRRWSASQRSWAAWMVTHYRYIAPPRMLSYAAQLGSRLSVL